MLQFSQPVILASASPRRRELLAKVVADFLVIPADVDEESLTLENPFETAMLLARAKAWAVSQVYDGIVIGSDTVVAYESQGRWIQLAKPSSEADARRMLKSLSGRTHSVITGVTVQFERRIVSDFDEARVTFKNLSSLEIARYVETGEPMDKAGAYAIQGGASGFVAQLEGDIETVIGFPTKLVRELLSGFAQDSP